MSRPSVRTLGYLVAWVAAAVVAVTIGLVAVTGVGASVRDRGPLTGQAQQVREALADAEGVATADPGAARTSETFDGDFGSFEVTCQGAVAFGDGADGAAGWRVVSYEQGPDDDVDAVFASGSRSVELEVFCDAGRPTISDREDKTLPED
jgi:hypothetical protein